MCKIAFVMKWAENQNWSQTPKSISSLSKTIMNYTQLPRKSSQKNTAYARIVLSTYIEATHEPDLICLLQIFPCFLMYIYTDRYKIGTPSSQNIDSTGALVQSLTHVYIWAKHIHVCSFSPKKDENENQFSNDPPHQLQKAHWIRLTRYRAVKWKAWPVTIAIICDPAEKNRNRSAKNLEVRQVHLLFAQVPALSAGLIFGEISRHLRRCVATTFDGAVLRVVKSFKDLSERRNYKIKKLDTKCHSEIQNSLASDSFLCLIHNLRRVKQNYFNCYMETGTKVLFNRLSAF